MNTNPNEPRPRNLRRTLGTTLVVGGFLVTLYAAFQHGSLCSSMPALDVASGHTEPYFCKSYAGSAYATPLQSALRTEIAPLAALGILLGAWLRRRD